MEAVPENRKRIYVYPNSIHDAAPEGNDYIRNLKQHLNSHFDVVSDKPTRRRLLDILFRIRHIDIIYFNWIENLPDKRYGYLQIPLLVLIMFIARIRKIRIAWFVHNNISHTSSHRIAKWLIVQLMQRSNFIFSHSRAVSSVRSKSKIYFFDHPFNTPTPVHHIRSTYDLLIWGRISAYKGILEFVQAVANTPAMHQYKILIAGKFTSAKYYQQVQKFATPNITIINRSIPEEELVELFSQTRFVLFTYNSSSVLSSGALCRSLQYGMPVVGPNIGSFAEMAKLKLIHIYSRYDEIDSILRNRQESIDPAKVDLYMHAHSWENFAKFLADIFYERMSVAKPKLQLLSSLESSSANRN